MLLITNQITSQTVNYLPPSEGNFDYEDCGCKGTINLKIYNGLVSPYGGQNVPETNNEEFFKGAVTVANRNNTNGDFDSSGAPIIDFMQNVVTATNGKDRNEIDLMRLDILKTGTFAPACSIVTIEYSGNIKFWSASNKVSPVNLNIPISNLPLTIYVEATTRSSTSRH